MTAPSGFSDTLRKEVFHRVSNNFQIIQSMLRVVSHDPMIEDLPKEMEERIQLLSIAHHALHCIDSDRLHPIDEALPNLILGLTRGGFLDRKTVDTNINVSTLSVQRTYAVLHIVVEVARAINKSSARTISITLDATGLQISCDSDDVRFNKSSYKLTTAFARELGGMASWLPNGLRVEISGQS